MHEDPLFLSTQQPDFDQHVHLAVPLAGLADYLAEFGGSWKFIGAFMLFLVFWCVANTWLLSYGFDSFPFVFLGSCGRP